MQVLNLSQRIGLEPSKHAEQLTLISFNSGAKNSTAVIVDEIIGMYRVDINCIQKNDDFYASRARNIGLLFPTTAMIQLSKKQDDLQLIHLLDSTYLDNEEPVTEDAGELELF